MRLVKYIQSHNEIFGLPKDNDLSENDRFQVFSIEDDIKIIGFIILDFKKQEDKECYLKEIEIIHNKRRLGYGKQSIDILVNYLKNKGIKVIRGIAIFEAIDFWNYIFKEYNVEKNIIKECNICRYINKTSCIYNITDTLTSNNICEDFQYDFLLNIK